MITPREVDHAIPKMRNSYNNEKSQRREIGFTQYFRICNTQDYQMQLMCHQRFSFFSGQGSRFMKLNVDKQLILIQETKFTKFWPTPWSFNTKKIVHGPKIASAGFTARVGFT